ncbi:hypothetical protein [uncultured Campylobacter sp.]|nr:hypothetical protein [uncultured Campylobacter sp.]
MISSVKFTRQFQSRFVVALIAKCANSDEKSQVVQIVVAIEYGVRVLAS